MSTNAAAPTGSGEAPPGPQFIIVAGPNGAGKTTASAALVTRRHGVRRIVNPDPIAMGIAGVPELGAIVAGRLAIDAQKRYIADRADFAIETTLSGRRWHSFLGALNAASYRVSIYYLWVPDPELCLARVRTRVMVGGHGVAPADILRRYQTGIENLFRVFIPRVHE